MKTKTIMSFEDGITKDFHPIGCFYIVEIVMSKISQISPICAVRYKLDTVIKIVGGPVTAI